MLLFLVLLILRAILIDDPSCYIPDNCEDARLNSWYLNCFISLLKTLQYLPFILRIKSKICYLPTVYLSSLLFPLTLETQSFGYTALLSSIMAIIYHCQPLCISFSYMYSSHFTVLVCKTWPVRQTSYPSSSRLSGTTLMEPFSPTTHWVRSSYCILSVCSVYFLCSTFHSLFEHIFKVCSSH